MRAVTRAQDSFVLLGRRELSSSAANLLHQRLFGSSQLIKRQPILFCRIS